MNQRILISKRLVLINSVSSLAAWLIRLTVLVWLQQYLLKRISEDEYSLFPVIASIVAFVPILPVIFIGGIERYVIEAWARDDDYRIKQITSTVAPIIWLIALATMLLGVLAVWKIDWIIKIDPIFRRDGQWMMGLLVFDLAFGLAVNPFLVGLGVRQRYLMVNGLQLLQELIRLVLLYGLIFTCGPRVLWVVVATVGAGLVIRPIWVMMSCRAVPALRFAREAFTRGLMRELFSFGAWTVVGRLADTFRQMMDPIILNRLATPFDVNCFYLGSLPPKQIESAWALARVPLTPVLTAAFATGQIDRIRNGTLRGGRLSLWIVLLPVIPLIVFYREFWTLYLSSEYVVAGVVCALLMTYWFQILGACFLPQVAHSSGAIRSYTLRVMAIETVNLFLTLVLVGVFKLGAIGSAGATMIVHLIGDPLLLWPLLFKLSDINFRQAMREAVVPGLIPSVFSFATLLIAQRVHSPMTWLAFGVECALGAVAYCVGLLFFALKPQDRADIDAAIKRLAWRG